MRYLWQYILNYKLQFVCIFYLIVHRLTQIEEASTNQREKEVWNSSNKTYKINTIAHMEMSHI